MPLSESHERYVNFYTDFAFKKLFGTDVNKELSDYRESQKDYWDLFSVVDTAERKGEVKGREEERLKAYNDKIASARNFKALGTLTDSQIADALGLTVDEVINA